jgi:predicted dehydrogenase
VKGDRAEEIAKKFNVGTTYTDYKQMLKKEQLDAVVVGTPNAYHAEQSIAGLNAGCHVLVEKPMAGTLAEARAMIKASEKSGKFLMVGQNQRLAPAHVKAKKVLDRGELGKVLTFQTSFKHRGPDGWSVDGAKSWFFRKKEAVMGVCGDLGVHKIDLMRYLLGQEFVEVSAFVETLEKVYPGTKTKIDVDDNAIMNVKTDKGVVGQINISWTHYGGFEDNGTVIFCENGVLAIGTEPNYGVVVHYKDYTKDFHKTGAMSTNEKQVSSGVMGMFVAGIKANKAPPINGHEGFRSLQVILGALESAKTGKTVKIKPE